MIALLIGTFLAVVLTGPGWDERRARKTALRDRPLARVVYLPSACCRGSESEGS